MADDSDMLFDPTMKKKKKKKAPINLDELDAEAQPAEVEVKKTDAAPEVIDKQPKPEKTAIADDLDLDDFSNLKKKKKKKREVAADAVGDAMPAEGSDPSKDKQTKSEKIAMTDDLDLDDFSSLKKKKKKKRDRNLLDMDAIGEALPDDGSEQSKEEKSNEPAEDDTREYTYEELLKRVFEIMRAKNPNLIEGGKRKFVMKPPQVVRVGTKKTSFVNFTDICKILHRQPKHLLAFLLAELGTSGTVDGTNQLIIKGKFQQKHIENVLIRYIKEYVTCHTCRSPETILHKETRLFFLQCETCDSRCSVASIKSGFQAVTTKRARLKNKQ